MRTYSPPHRFDNETRWLNQLEPPSPLFWQALLSLKHLQLQYHHPCLSFETPVQLKSGFLDSNQTLVLPQPSLSLNTRNIEHIFGIEFSPEHKSGLEFDFTHHQFRLRLESPRCPSTLDFLSASFGWEMKPESPELLRSRQLKNIPLCNCCAEAAQNRIETLENNPLVQILRHQIDSSTPLLFSINQPDCRLLDSFQPEFLQLSHNWIFATNSQQTLALDVTHLHAFVGNKMTIDQIPHFEIRLLNTHGHHLGSLAAPSHLVQKHWNNRLTNSPSYSQTQ
ncbi:MAG: hypothetical protein AAGC74_07860 [Verrucomicrobiota bacterium]